MQCCHQRLFTRELQIIDALSLLCASINLEWFSSYDDLFDTKDLFIISLLEIHPSHVKQEPVMTEEGKRPNTTVLYHAVME